jgi:hypothetical protein
MCVLGKEEGQTKGTPTFKSGLGHMGFIPRGSGVLATHREGSIGFKHACTLGNEPWRMECDQIIVSEAHEGEWSRHAQVRKMCRAEQNLEM